VCNIINIINDNDIIIINVYESMCSNSNKMKEMINENINVLLLISNVMKIMINEIMIILMCVIIIMIIMNSNENM